MQIVSLAQLTNLPRYRNSLQYTFNGVSNISKSPTGNAAMRAILVFSSTDNLSQCDGIFVNFVFGGSTASSNGGTLTLS